MRKQPSSASSTSPWRGGSNTLKNLPDELKNKLKSEFVDG